MGSNKYYRRYIEKMIAANPVTITITRTTKVDDGFGGIDEQRAMLPPQTVTIYNRKAQREIISDSGATMVYTVASVEKMLAMPDADVMEGDEFTHAGREYRVVFVNDLRGICKQAEVEAIK